MRKKVKSPDEVNTMAQSLIGLEVTLPWKGHGSTIFLELGELSTRKSKRGDWEVGEAHISVNWDWRVELGAIIKFGSSLEGSKIERGLRSLQGVKVQNIYIQGRIPEMVVEFSSGHILRSMVMVPGGPEWTLKLGPEKYLHPYRGSIVIGTGNEPGGYTEQEAIVVKYASEASVRWGKPHTESQSNQCSACRSFVTLNGGFDLTYHGVCMAPESPFDGRVVHDESGCEVFTANEEPL